MFSKSEAFYDAIYGTMKDYDQEEQQVHARIVSLRAAFLVSGRCRSFVIAQNQ